MWASSSYDDLKRPFTDKTPADRVIVSMGLGTLIADGFLIVQTEKVDEMEFVGRAMIKYGKALGAGGRMNKHTQSLFEHSLRGELGIACAEELAKPRPMWRRKWSCCGMWTSRISSASAAGCGRWRSPRRASRSITPRKRPASSRAVTSSNTTSAASTACTQPFEERQNAPGDLRKGIEELLPMVDVPEGKALTHDEIKKLQREGRRALASHHG
jgi:hypothetical protein